jgi:hypothetical protein
VQSEEGLSRLTNKTKVYDDILARDNLLHITAPHKISNADVNNYMYHYKNNYTYTKTEKVNKLVL